MQGKDRDGGVSLETGRLAPVKPPFTAMATRVKHARVMPATANERMMGLHWSAPGGPS